MRKRSEKNQTPNIIKCSCFWAYFIVIRKKHRGEGGNGEQVMLRHVSRGARAWNPMSESCGGDKCVFFFKGNLVCFFWCVMQVLGSPHRRGHVRSSSRVPTNQVLECPPMAALFLAAFCFEQCNLCSLERANFLYKIVIQLLLLCARLFGKKGGGTKRKTDQGRRKIRYSRSGRKKRCNAG